jgi:MoaA/NifB/PqqE/SkfB family radical SAM enzyme
MNLIAMLTALWQFGVRKKPLILSHTINSECNLHCRFCPFRRKGKEMEKAEIFSMLEQAKSMGIMVYNIWAVEPLLRKDLPDCLAYASSLGLTTSLITNGVLLEERVDELSRLDFLSVSFDGIKTYEEIRECSVEKVLRGIKKAREKGLNVMLNCVLNGKNLIEVEDLIKLAKALGTWISFEPLQEYEEIPQAVWNEIGIRDLQSYKRAVDSIIKMKREGYPVVNSYTYLNMIRGLKPQFKCYASEIILHVSLDGKIVNCRDREICLGNVEEGLAIVWKRSKAIRKKLAEECKGCLAFGYVESSLACDMKLEVLFNYGKHLSKRKVR